MTVNCITCEHFTLKPRTGEEQELLRASDIAHARVGMGRCLKESLTQRWQAAETERHCDMHSPVPSEQAAQRREWIKGRKS